MHLFSALSCNLSSFSKKKTQYSAQRRKHLRPIPVLRAQTDRENPAPAVRFCRLSSPSRASGFHPWHHPAFLGRGEPWCHGPLSMQHKHSPGHEGLLAAPGWGTEGTSAEMIWWKLAETDIPTSQLSVP